MIYVILSTLFSGYYAQVVNAVPRRDGICLWHIPNGSWFIIIAPATRFSKWKKDGTLVGLNSQLNMMLREQEGREATPSAVSIDSQSIKKAPFICEETGIDGNKKINGRKRHILTDTIGLIWVAVVHAANLHDGVMAEQVVTPVLGYLHRLKKVFADMAYKSDRRCGRARELVRTDVYHHRLGDIIPSAFFYRLRASEDTLGH